MAHQSAVSKDKPWITGSPESYSGSATRWVKSERYLELKQLEQDATKISNKIQNLEAEIRDLSATFEKLKKLDAQRVERLGQLVGAAGTEDEAAVEPPAENLDTPGVDGVNGQHEEEVIAKVERSGGGDVDEQLASLKREHEAAQSEILQTQASFEQKQTELEMLSGEYKTLTDLIAKEEKLVQAVEMEESSQQEESFQQSVAVQHEMRSLSEDLGRLGRLVEGLKDSNADQQKQSLSRAQQKQRVFHPVTSIRGRNHSKNLLSGGALDLGRSVSLGGSPSGSRSKDASGSKEPAEFEERGGGGNRKRQKSSTFELERARLHEQRAKLDVEGKEARLHEQRAKLESEAKEKKRSESMAGRPSRPSKRASSPRGRSSGLRAHILNPPSVSEGLEEFPSLESLASSGSLGPVRAGSAGSTSASPELSEFAIEKVDPDLFSAAAKRLDFASAAKREGTGSGSGVPFQEDTASSATSEEESTGNVLNYKSATLRGLEVTQVEEVESEGSTWGKVEEGLPSENGSEGTHISGGFGTEVETEEVQVSEILSTEGETDEISKPEVLSPGSVTGKVTQVEEVESEGSSWGKGEESLPSENGIKEIQKSGDFSMEVETEGIQGSEISSAEGGIEEIPKAEVFSSDNVTEEMQGPGVLRRERGTEEMQGPAVLSPESGPEEVQKASPEEIPKAEVFSSDNVTEEMQGPGVLRPERGTEEMQGPAVLSPESGPEEVQKASPEAEDFQQADIPWAILEQFVQTENGTDDSKKTLEETEIHSLGEAAKAPGEEEVEEEVEEFDIHTDEIDTFRDAGEQEETEEDSREQQVLTAGNGMEEIDIPSEEFDIRGAEDKEENEDSGEEEVLPAENGVEEIVIPEEDIEDFEDAEPADEIRQAQIPSRIVEGEKPTEVTQGPGDEEDKYEASEVWSPLVSQTPLLQNGAKGAQTSVRELQSAPEAEQLQAGEGSVDLNEHRPWRLEAENQMMQLTSQLSLLQKQVEEEVESHEKAKNDLEFEHTSTDKEHLSKQVSFFADEVRGLRQNIDEIQCILYREGGDLSVVEHWAKDLHSKCADQSAQLEHLGKQVSVLARDLKQHLKLRVDIDGKLDKQAQERQNVEGQPTDLSISLGRTVSTIAKEEEAVEELVEQQKHLLVDQLKEAEKLRHIAEVRVGTLNKQIEQLELVCDVAQNIQVVSKYQDKALKYGFQTLVQLFMLAVGVITLYSRVVEPFRGSLVPT